MRAVVFHQVGDIRLDNVPEPKIRKPTDAIIRITAAAICGTDLHMVRGTMSGMKSGTILGHEGLGIVEEVGKDVRNFRVGDRVVIPSTIACGYCVYCRAGYYSQCDNANENGPGSGTAFFGGPKDTGPVDGLQAEFARIPFASVGMVRVPENVSDDQAILVSDIFPTGYFGAELAEICSGDTVAVFGCGPVGLFAILSARLKGAGRIFAVDAIPSRLAMAADQGAEVIDYNEDDPVEKIKELTGGIGVDRAIDAVGIDAERPHSGPARKKADKKAADFQKEQEKAAPVVRPDGENWIPGDSPSIVLQWATEALAKAGTLSIIGVYPGEFSSFPIGSVMGKNITVKAGSCDHRRYIPCLLDRIRTGEVDPTKILTEREPLTSALEAYKLFDLRKPGWVKVKLEP